MLLNATGVHNSISSEVASLVCRLILCSYDGNSRLFSDNILRILTRKQQPQKQSITDNMQLRPLADPLQRIMTARQIPTELTNS